jgi:c-di-GMP-binding flagellar brake protein YcgR
MPSTPDVLDRRAAKRVKCQLRAIVRSNDKPFTSTITDLSVTGCRVRMAGREAAMRLQPELLIQLVDADLELRGSMVWRRGEYVGVRFDLTRVAGTARRRAAADV